jgi:hypothetical protein
LIPDEKERGRYYREIAAAFLRHRGAPFFLSAKDLDLVSKWERSGLPLPVVLEGIESAFDALRPGARPRGKVLSLAYCEIPVARAWERHRDRKVGGTRKIPGIRDRRAAARKEIDRFLAAVPPGREALREIFLAAKTALDKAGASDEDLERFDEKVENELRAGASVEDTAEAREAVRAEHGKLVRAEIEKAAAVLLVKRLRAEFKVPYLSLFYY